MKRVGVHHAGLWSILWLVILHSHKVCQKDECVACAVVFQLEIEVVDYQQIVVPMVLAMSGFFQCLLGGVCFQVSFQGLCNGLNLFLL